jgi:hypothetical protein
MQNKSVSVAGNINTKRRIIVKSCLAVIGLSSALSFHAYRANAYTAYGCNWGAGKTFLSFTNNVGWEANTAGARWNSGAARLRFIQGGGDFTVEGVNAGNVPWAGLTHDPGTYVSWNQCSVGTVVTKNTYYGPPNTNEDVLTHEFGHVAGLADINAASPGCVGGNFFYSAVMHYSMDRVLGPCGIFDPQTDDINGVNSIY